MAVSGSRKSASPLARRLAREKGIDLAGVAGSGPRGRIIARDILERTGPSKHTALKASSEPPLERAYPSLVPVETPFPDDKISALYDEDSYEVIPHDGMRRTIAQRLTLAAQTIPHFRLAVECRMDELLQARARLNAAAPSEGSRGAYKLSVNDFLIKALALALRDVPAANATWTSRGMLRHRHCGVGVAVAVDGGLYTPVIRQAELKSLSEISNEVKDLAGRARGRRLKPHEYQGGSTSISNLGMYGVEAFDAIINPPHATILAAGAASERAVVIGGKIKTATMMTCTLSCDHRVVDGALGAALLAAFKSFVEDPVRMII